MSGILLALCLACGQTQIDMTGWTWKKASGEGQYQLIAADGRVAGWYDCNKKEWWQVTRYDGARQPVYTLLPGREPPMAPPCKNFGVSENMLRRSAERFTLSGKPVSREEAVSQIGGDQLPDLKDKLRVTIIGPKADREAVERDLQASAWKDKIVLSGYDPDHWHVREAGFSCTGKPTIYVQDAGGKVLHRQDDYSGGPEGLTAALEAATLRRPNPKYDPKKDFDLRKWLPGTGGIPLAVWVLGGAALLVVLVKLSRGNQ